MSGLEVFSWTDPVSETKHILEMSGIGSLLVDDLEYKDLELISWSGSPIHIKSVSKALAGVALGVTDCLAVRAANGLPVSKAVIDYLAHEGSGAIWQLATRGDLQGLGIGTRLVAEAEKRI